LTRSVVNDDKTYLAARRTRQLAIIFCNHSSPYGLGTLL
jgi:hypothetical protein